MPPKIKHEVRVTLKKKGKVVQDNIDSSTYVHTYGAYLRVPVVQKIGVPITYTVTVEYLGEKQYKQTLQQRTKAYDRSQERTKKWKEEQAKLELERQEKQLVQRRERITNQIELAFVKKISGAVNFITCDKCDGTATHLGLAYENPGSSVIDPDQITGAWCQEHHGTVHQNIFYAGYRPYKTKANIECSQLEFFYDGLRQLAVRAA